MPRLLSTLLLLFAPLVLTSGCEFGGNEASGRDNVPDDGTDSPGMGGEAPEAGCEIAADCTLAASTCCDCPSFAVSRNGGFGDSCEEVDCEPADMCPAIVPRCDQNQCQISCAAIVTDKSCEFGFVRDAAGCLRDECNVATSLNGCTQASECVQIPGDCCGCSRGGADQAVLSGRVGAATKDLACDGSEICPEVNVCNAEDSPQCVAGTCVLTTVTTTDVPPDLGALCGDTGLAGCADGLICVLNQADSAGANTLGVGTCVESP